MRHCETIVVGGGVTGLAAVHHLGAEGVRDLALVEPEERLGGKLRTERDDGFVVEGGPDCFLTVKSGAIDLCRAIGLADRLAGSVGGRVHIKRGGRLFEIPEGVIGLAPSRALPLMATSILSLRGRMRAALEPFLPARSNGADETVAAFATRRFGREAYTWLMEPLMGGIHAADGDRLSLAATFPQLSQLEREHGSVMRGMFRRAAAYKTGSTRSPFVAPAGGMQEIAERLERDVPEGARVRGKVVKLTRRGDAGFVTELADGTAIHAGSVILAVPAPAAAGVLEPLDAALAASLREISFVSVVTVTFAVDAADVRVPTGSSGYLTPRAEGGLVSACTVSSNKFRGRAPEANSLIRVFLGRAGEPDPTRLEDADLIAAAATELRSTFSLATDPARVWITRWPEGMPQYNTGHLERVARIERLASHHPGLFVAGASYRGVGVPDCVESGRRAAEAVRKRGTPADQR